MLKRLDLVLDSRKFVQEWPEKRQFLVKLRQIWNDFRHCAGSISFFSSLLSDRLLLAAALDPCEPKFASFCRLSLSDWAVILTFSGRYLSGGWL